MGERLPQLLKALRREVHGIKLKKLMALDRSDRFLIEQEVETSSTASSEYKQLVKLNVLSC